MKTRTNSVDLSSKFADSSSEKAFYKVAKYKSPLAGPVNEARA